MIVKTLDERVEMAKLARVRRRRSGSPGKVSVKWTGVFFVLYLVLPMQAVPGVQREGAGRAVTECTRIQLDGAVTAGKEWQAAVGQGWRIRLVPIAPSGKGYQGCDLAFDRESGGGYPDALLLATPPYGSLNEREIGTTFGLRAQDAIAWSPRRFRFLTTVGALEQGRKLFGRLATLGGGRWAVDGDVSRELLQLVSGASEGKLTIASAEIVTGTADPAPYARQWATQLGRVPHTILPSQGAGSERGEVHLMRFTITLALPKEWKTAPGVPRAAAGCAL